MSKIHWPPLERKCCVLCGKKSTKFRGQFSLGGRVSVPAPFRLCLDCIRKPNVKALVAHALLSAVTVEGRVH